MADSSAVARVCYPALGRFLQTDPVGYEDDLNLYAYVRNDPLNLSDPTGREVFEDHKFKVTLSLGVSGTVAAPTSGFPGENAGADLAVELGVAPNNPDSLVSSGAAAQHAANPIMQVGMTIASMISIDRVAVQTSDGVTGNDTGSIGAIADVDIGDVGLSLGTIADREGMTGSGEVDLGPAGGEVFSGGELAGSGVRLSLYGPGAGVAISASETETVASKDLSPHRRSR